MVSYLTIMLRVLCTEGVCVLGMVALLYGYLKISNPHQVS
mgnify:CR=1 FL=1